MIDDGNFLCDLSRGAELRGADVRRINERFAEDEANYAAVDGPGVERVELEGGEGDQGWSGEC